MSTVDIPFMTKIISLLAATAATLVMTASAQAATQSETKQIQALSQKVAAERKALHMHLSAIKWYKNNPALSLRATKPVAVMTASPTKPIPLVTLLPEEDRPLVPAVPIEIKPLPPLYVQVPDFARRQKAQASLLHHQAAIAPLKRLYERDKFTLSVVTFNDRDFETAVHIAANLLNLPSNYEHWVLGCADSEGGRGLFVMNRGGSGAGGWMQFMNSTFYGNIGSAVDAVLSRSRVVLPLRFRDWHSPLGQAVTAMWMFNHEGAGQWTGVGC